MKFDLTKPLPTRVSFKDRNYALDLSFANVMKIYDLMKCDELISEEKCALMLAVLVKEKNPPPELLDIIFKDFISISSRRSCKDSGMRTVDFKQDGIYIYSSFMHDYGIDLIKERRRLHWQKFIALFSGLSECTKIREIMKIRSMEIPERNKHNGKFIADLIELKQYYALDITIEEREQNFKKGLAGLADALIARAKK